MLKVKTIPVGQMQANCYVVYDEEEGSAFIIDPGDDGDFIADTIRDLDLKPLSILVTHGHFDHNLAGLAVKLNFNIAYLISKEDSFLLKKMPESAEYFLGFKADPAPQPDKFLNGKSKLNIGKSFFRVIETPGHTPGSLCFYNPIENILFCGDLLFKGGSIGRYDFSYSDKKALFSSLDAILKLPDETVIYPGHGDPTTVGEEKIFLRKRGS